MNSAHKYFLALVSFLFLFLLSPGNALAWDPAVQENVIVFDADGQAVASYHTGDWADMVDAPGKVTFSHWTNGSPPSQSSTDATPIVLTPGMVAVPNFTGQSSTPPSAAIPEVSIYSFDAALFLSTTPGETPALSVSHPSGTYQETIGLQITAHTLYGTASVEIQNEDSSWQSIGDNSATLYISRDRTLTLRAASSGVYSTERILNYSIEQAPFIDSDGDGLPDIWEIAHGLNPLGNSGDSTHNSPDSDGDGISDFDEILRHTDPFDPGFFPADSDNDNWSDWDELYLRGTDPLDPLDTPTATRLYEVETMLSGQFLGYNNDPVANSDYRIETLQQRILAEDTSTSLSSYLSRVPLGSEAVIRVVDASNNGFIYKRYLPSIADPLFSDMAFDESNCSGDISTWHEQWQDALVQFLAASLVTDTPDYDVTTGSMLPLALLERQLELLTESVPQAVADGLTAAHPETDPLPWLAFASHGHRPDNATLFMLQQLLENERQLAWNSSSPQSTRSINTLMEELNTLATSPCHLLQSSIEDFYALMSPDEQIEEEVGRLLQGQQGSYLAGLLLLYSMDSLNSYPQDLCTLLSPTMDSDGDGLLNHEETPQQDLVDGLADPFNNDSDLDGWLDSQDNCPLVVNQAQHDWDGDGAGDLCDNDDDNDGLSDAVELAFGSNPYATDTNENGFTDEQEWNNGTNPGVAVYLTDYSSPSNQTTQTVSGYREEGSNILINIDNGATAGAVEFPSSSSWRCTLDSMAGEGDYQLTLSGSDPVDPNRSGVSHYTLNIDLTPPLISIITPADGSFTREENPLVEYTVSDGQQVISIDSNTIQLASGERLPALGMGSHQLVVHSTDLAGNQGSQLTTFTVPDLPIGDIDNNDIVDLTDLILVMQIGTQKEGEAPVSGR